MAIKDKDLRKIGKKDLISPIESRTPHEIPNENPDYSVIPSKKPDFFNTRASKCTPLDNPFFKGAMRVHQKQIDRSYQQAINAYATLFGAYVDLARETGRQVPGEVMDAFNQIGAEIERARQDPLQNLAGCTNLAELGIQSGKTPFERALEKKEREKINYKLSGSKPIDPTEYDLQDLGKKDNNQRFVRKGQGLISTLFK